MTLVLLMLLLHCTILTESFSSLHLSDPYGSRRRHGVLKFLCRARRFSRRAVHEGRERRKAASRKESCGGATPQANKTGHCMKNRLSLLAARGRGFRRPCSTLLLSQRRMRKWQAREWVKKKGDRRNRNKCTESDVKGLAFILPPAVYLLCSIIFTDYIRVRV